MLIDEKTLTVKESAEILHVTQESILDLIKRGELPASNINTRPGAQRPRWRILSSDLGRFLMRTRHQVAPPPKPHRKVATAKDYFA